MNGPPSRWKDALAIAARKTVAARRQALLEDLARARQEQQQLLSEPNAEIRAIRKCAKRIHDLEQVCLVLGLELSTGLMSSDRPPGNVVIAQR